MSQTGSTETIDPAGERTPPSGIQQAVQAIANLILPTNKSLITLLRTPTPVKITKLFLTDSNGCIGHGLDTPDPELLYTCPMSAEAWLHRITISSPEHNPATPLTQGELLCTGTSAGEIIFCLPETVTTSQVCPAQLIEGSLSAPHLNPGERAVLVGDQLPVGIHIRIDLQINLVEGISEYTPRSMSPTDLRIKDADSYPN